MKTQKPKPLPKKGKSNSTAGQVSEPIAAFLATDEMSEFLNAQQKAEQAAERGDAEVSLPAALMSRIFAVTQPMDLEHLRKRFNQLCDELGQPGEKEPEPPAIEYDPETGPF